MKPEEGDWKQGYILQGNIFKWLEFCQNRPLFCCIWVLIGPFCLNNKKGLRPRDAQERRMAICNPEMLLKTVGEQNVKHM